MKWLARLKNSCDQKTDATKPTKPPQEGEDRGSVGFVAYPQPHLQKIEGALAAANDASAAARHAWQICLVPDTPSATVDFFQVASQALDARIDAAERSTTLHDGCWPHGEAMSGQEIDTFMARLGRFTDKGMSLHHSEALADKLVSRDREHDDRRLCLECTHLHGTGNWRCGNWQRAAVAISARHAQLPNNFVNLLQRCGGFMSAHRPTTDVVAPYENIEKPTP